MNLMEILPLIILGLAIGIIMCNCYKKQLNQKLLDDVDKAIKNGGCIKLKNGVVFDFSDGVILDKYGKQIKCIYR